VSAQAVVYGAQEAGPEPCVVFGCEVGGVVWKLLGGGRREENLGWILVEDSEELRACVGRKGDVGDRRGVADGWRDRERRGEDEGEV
jgi:hypothetical protein